MRSRSSTTTSFATATARLSRRRWPSSSATSSSSPSFRSRYVTWRLLSAPPANVAYFFCQLVDQNSALKKEAGIAERKLLARNERIQNLEALLQDADRRLAAQNQKFEQQLQAVKERLDQARGKSSMHFAGNGLSHTIYFCSPKGRHFITSQLWPHRQAIAWRRWR